MDYAVEQWINAPAGNHAGLDALMQGLADWGEALFIAIMVSWLAIAWLRGGTGERRGALTGLLGAGGALLVNQILGALWNRPRPFVAHPATVDVLIGHARDGSFPSDHAAAGFAIAFALFLVHRRLGALALVLATVMSAARVYVGVHYPGDVLAGAAIGIAVSWGLTYWAGRPLDWIEGQLERGAAAMHLPVADTDKPRT